MAGENKSKLTFGAVKGEARTFNGTEACICAVLQYHKELPKDDKGVATHTIRELLTALGNSTIEATPVLKEYICAFGQHGVSVVKRVVSDDPECQRDFEDDVAQRYKYLKSIFG